MTTAIEDDQLNTELQELYLLSKHWISDLEFLERDLEFLKNLFGKVFSPLIQKDDFEKIDILVRAAKIDKEQAGLRNEISIYLHRLEQLISNCNQNFEINLIETYTQLEHKLTQVLLDLKSVKKIVFDLTKEGFKEDTTTLPVDWKFYSPNQSL